MTEFISRELIIQMVGTKGLEELTHITELLPRNNNYHNLESLICHLVNKGIAELKQVLLNELQGLKE